MGFRRAVALTLGVSFVSLQGIGSLEAKMQKVIDVDARKQSLAGEVDVVLANFMLEERGIIRRADMNDMPAVAKYNHDFETGVARFKERMGELGPIANSPAERTMLEQLLTASTAIFRNHKQFMQMISDGDIKGAGQFVTVTVMPLIKQTSPIAEKLVDLQRELMEASGAVAKVSVTRSRWLKISMIVLSLVVAAAVIVIVRQIDRMLLQVVGELAEGANQTASAAFQVASAGQSLAQGSSEQAASLEETSASTEEINSMSHTQSDKISKIIKVIDEIAF